jgi:hypothetical protein
VYVTDNHFVGFTLQRNLAAASPRIFEEASGKEVVQRQHHAPNAHAACRISRRFRHRVWGRHQGKMASVNLIIFFGLCCVVDFSSKAGKWGSKSYPAAYKAGYAAGVLREQKKELHAQQMMQVMYPTV